MDEKESRIRSITARLGITYDQLTSNQQKKLRDIDDAIVARQKRLEKAKSELKDAQITILSIADDIHVARGTIYNNDVYKKYVDAFKTADETQIIISKAEYDSDKQRLKDQDEQIQHFLNNDVNIMEKNYEIKKLQAELRLCQQNGEYLNSKIEEYRKRLDELENNNGNSSNVIEFPSKDKK